jgi:ATP-dependent Clp protease ATP-binding subunit ClpX
MHGVSLVFSDDAFEATATLAMARNTGARGLRNIVETSLLDTMFQVPSIEGVHTVYIDADSIEGKKDAVILSGDKTLDEYLNGLNANIEVSDRSEAATG